MSVIRTRRDPFSGCTTPTSTAQWSQWQDHQFAEHRSSTHDGSGQSTRGLANDAVLSPQIGYRNLYYMRPLVGTAPLPLRVGILPDPQPYPRLQRCTPVTVPDLATTAFHRAGQASVFDRTGPRTP